MSSEATSQEPEGEGAQGVSTDGDGTANETGLEAGDGGKSEVELPESVKSDFEKLPENQRSHHETEFKRYLTKYTQGQAAEIKQKELEFEQTKRQLDELKFLARDMVENPDKINYYRQHFGIKDNKPVNEEPPKFETMGDVLDYIKKQDEKIKSLEQGLPQKVAELSKNQIGTYDANIRYAGALDRVKSESPSFKKYEPFIIDLMVKTPELMGLHNGTNDYEVLKAAENKFLSLIKEDIEAAKREQLESLKVKKAASTLTPQKHIKSKTVNSADIVDSIIASVNERYPR